MRYLNFVTQQGLCNRLRGLLCAIGAAEASARKLLVTWDAGPVCGATMDDLWVHDLHVLSWPVSRTLLRLGGGWRHDKVMSNRRMVMARSVHTWALDIQPRPWIDNLARLQLRPDLQARVDEVGAPLVGRPVLGVSARLHKNAHTRSRAESPATWYESRIGQILTDNPGAAVFVSCDVPEITQAWCNRWPDVHTLPSKGAYGTAHGVQDALCDLHLLARCSYLLGAVESSLSETAAVMRGGDRMETSARLPGISVAEAFETAFGEPETVGSPRG